MSNEYLWCIGKEQQQFLIPNRYQYLYINNISMSNSFDLDSNLLFEEIGDIQSNLNSENDQIFSQQALQSTVTTSEEQSSSAPLSKNKQNSVKDCNPNLLKNLVVTLRSWVTIKEPNFSKLEIEIWRYFKQTKKINKNLLWTVYGNINDDPDFLRMIQDQIPGMLGVGIEQFQKIQNHIKDETVSQLRKADINYILKYRRVKDRDQFNRYFYQFVKKLENGQGYSKKLK